MKTPFLADQLVSVVVLVLYFVVGFPCPSDARGVGPIVTTEYPRGRFRVCCNPAIPAVRPRSMLERNKALRLDF